MTNENILSDSELDSIVNAAADFRKEIVNDMETIKKDIKIDENAPLEANDNSTTTMDIDLFDANSEENIENKITEKTAAIAKDSFNLSDDDAIQLIDTIKYMNQDPNYPVYDHLPAAVRDIISKLMVENDIPIKYRNKVARVTINEMMEDAGSQEMFIDLQKALDDALKIPSIADLYTEHTKEVMEEKIPEMAENIKDVEPEKAKLLMDVKNMFSKSYTFELAKDAYENSATIRKAVRKNESEIKRILDEFNFRNSKTNFLMNDATEMPTVLTHILIEEPSQIIDHATSLDPIVKDHIKNNRMDEAFDIMNIPNTKKIYNMKILKSDIQKFCIMICKSCENMDPHNIVDASYMYYMMKNIIMLKHTQESKTSFAAELINNICDTITFIRNKEAKFYAANLDKSKSTKKLRSNNSSRK